jgi:DNA-binding XRE family transcriptional regulator
MPQKGAFKNKIGFYMKHNRMNQAELSSWVGVRREYMNKLIHGRIQPGVLLALKIADALGVSVKDLYGEENK